MGFIALKNVEMICSNGSPATIRSFECFRKIIVGEYLADLLFAYFPWRESRHKASDSLSI